MLKKIFWCLIFAIILHEVSMANPVKISIPSLTEKLSINNFDPARISYTDEWDVAMNLYSRLVYFNAEGNLVSGLATKFYWVGSEAHFEIRDDFKTITGHKITPEDVAYSLKRVILRSDNTHGKIDDVICDAGKIKKLTDTCDGIKYNDKEIIIKTHKQSPFLFKTLTAADFSIIPKNSIDPKTLEIIDYKNTSGLYYFDGYNPNNHMMFKINQSHWLYSTKAPQEIEMVPVLFLQKDFPKSITEQFLNGNLDVLARSSGLSVNDIKKLSHTLTDKHVANNVNISESILLFFLTFSPRGFELKPDIRFAIQKDIHNAIIRQEGFLSESAYEPSNYIFPMNGHGGLSLEYNEKYIAKLQEPINPKTPKLTIEIAVTTKALPIFQKVLQGTYFTYKIIKFDNPQQTWSKEYKEKNMPILAYFNQDIMFEEDIGLLSYSFSFSNMFSEKGAHADKWLKNFKEELDVKKRMDMIHKLHYDSLVSNPSVIPLFTTRSGALAINGWNIKFPAFTADSMYWFIEK